MNSAVTLVALFTKPPALFTKPPAGGRNDVRDRSPIHGFQGFSGIVPGKAGNGSADGFVNSAVSYWPFPAEQKKCHGQECPPSPPENIHSFRNIFQSPVAASQAFFPVGTTPRGHSSCRLHSRLMGVSGIVPGKIMEWPGTVRPVAL